MNESLIQLTEKGYLDKGFGAELKFLSRFEETFPFYHDHDYFEIFLVTEGSVLHYINDQKILLKQGTLVFIRPHDQHRYERDGDNECQIINLAFRNHDMKALLRFLGPGFEAEKILDPTMPPTVYLSVIENEQLTNRLKNLHTIPISQKHRFQTDLRIALLEIISRFFIHPKTTHSDVPEWLVRLLSDMEKPEHFIQGITAMEELACKTQEHLCRVFKKHLDKTPTQYVNEQRLNYAANLLLRTDQKIIDIAFDSGFSNLSHFNHRFKTYFGMSPKNFRLNEQPAATIS